MTPKSTTKHALKLSAGPMLVTVTETPSGVFFAFDGVKPKDSELPKVSRFLWPLVDAYRDDTRPIEISGVNAPWTGHVNTLPDGSCVAYATEPGVQA